MRVGQITRQRGQLPVETTGFVGRDAELARLGALLGQARLVTVTGPPGVGKTRLALRAAARAAGTFADGVTLAELSAVDDPRLLPDTVAAALGLPAAGPEAGADPLLGYLSDRHLLLILDTGEHLVDACAVFAEAVIARAPRVTLLATSREPLDVSGENICPVAPLAVPEPDSAADGGPADLARWRGTAVDLFAQRASAAVPGLVFTPQDLGQVLRIVRRLDGLPLAIELAALRLRALPLADLASRLDQTLALLASGHQRGRHSSLQDAVAWSYRLCPPAEQALWARLSLFAGPFTMSAAEDVCADPPLPGPPLPGPPDSGPPDSGPPDSGSLTAALVMPTLIRLVDKSLLVRIDPGPAAGPAEPTRYLMLGAIREFGAGQLAGTQAEAPAIGRFIRRYLDRARSCDDEFLGHDQLGRLQELDQEQANLRAALQHALGDPAAPAGLDPAGPNATEPAAAARDGVELATALAVYWRVRCLLAEGSRWLGRAVQRAPDGSPARARALLAQAYLLTAQGRTDDALAAAGHARRLAAELRDGRLYGYGQLAAAGALCAAGQPQAAAGLSAQARRLLAAEGDTRTLVALDTQLAAVSLLSEDIEAALGHVECGLRRLSGSRERWLHARLYLLASLALYRAGRDVESTWTVTRALRAMQDAGDALGTAFSLELLAWLTVRAGNHQRAALLLGGAEPRWEHAGGRQAAAAFRWQHDEAVAACEGALGERRFAELLARGAAQRPAAVVSFALAKNAPDDAARSGPGLIPAQTGPAGAQLNGAQLTGDQPSGDQLNGDQLNGAEHGGRLTAGPAEHRGRPAGAGDPGADGNRRLQGQLTAREREIAGLVAAALSNRQIAEKLFISRRTVDAHLEHIFGKLNITSRVMLTIRLRDYADELASG